MVVRSSSRLMPCWMCCFRTARSRRWGLLCPSRAWPTIRSTNTGGRRGEIPVTRGCSSGNRQRNVLALFTPDLSDADTAQRGESILLPEHGYVFLREAGGGQEHRDYWDAKSRCAFFTFDRAGVHAHADRLSWMYFAEGALLLADREARATAPHAFSSDVQRQLNRSTICQNTVMIDGHDQRSPRETLRLVEYHVTPGEQRVSAADVKGLLFRNISRRCATIVLAPVCSTSSRSERGPRHARSTGLDRASVRSGFAIDDGHNPIAG